MLPGLWNSNCLKFYLTNQSWQLYGSKPSTWQLLENKRPPSRTQRGPSPQISSETSFWTPESLETLDNFYICVICNFNCGILQRTTEMAIDRELWDKKFNPGNLIKYRFKIKYNFWTLKTLFHNKSALTKESISLSNKVIFNLSHPMAHIN